jgi:5'-nucleotidase domain protein
MIMPINASQTNFLLATVQKYGLAEGKTEPNKPVRTSIFYINDFHGKSINIERTITASRAFDSFTKSENTDKLKLSSGDIQLGEPLEANKVMVEAQNIMGIMASAMGNHEYDMPKHISELIPHMGYKMLACNINIQPDNPLYDKVEKSYVQEVNGNKYGIIGITPVDLFSRLKYGKLFEELKIDGIDSTIKDVQTEVDKLKQQGVNKIILLSHVGFGYDQKIARETDGIDIILGGHSHNLVMDVKPGVNLFNSKSGEPVVITQAGRDGRFFGILNVEFNPKGVLTKVQNNVTSTRGFKRNAPARHVFEQILGKPKVVGQIKSAPPPLTNDSIEPSGHANFMCDCMKEELGTDIALFGSATIRGYFEPGNLDTRWLEDISPFKNKMVIASYTEKAIVDMLRVSAKSLVNTNNKPGIVHVSGLKYTISKDGNLRSASFIDKNGTETPINIDNPRADKTYRVGLTDYYSQGHDGFTMLKKYDQAEKIYNFDISKCIENHFERHPEPVEIKDDGRIKIVD